MKSGIQNELDKKARNNTSVNSGIQNELGRSIKREEDSKQRKQKREQEEKETTKQKKNKTKQTETDRAGGCGPLRIVTAMMRVEISVRTSNNHYDL